MALRKLDDVDARLLLELRSNARISHAQLGEIVRLSRNAVRQRIERLERDGVIGGYTIVEARPDTTLPVSGTLLVNRVDRMRGADVVGLLRAIPEVVRCEVVAGELDPIVRIEAADPGRIQSIWQQIAGHPGVRDITTALSLNILIDRVSRPHSMS